ncbi:MAG: YfiR family protein [Bacteroidota bacterium]|nr:YfiR family protein [Bacteroidota bacterium]
MKKSILIGLCLIFSTLLSTPLQAQYAKYKALYVYNFTKRIDWPENNKKGDFIIGIFGESKITEHLEHISKKKKVLNQPIIIKKYNSIEKIDFCHILFITKEQSKKLNIINVHLAGKATLTISEKKNDEACINFIENNKALLFQINPQMIRKRRMKLSQSLINLGIEIN